MTFFMLESIRNESLRVCSSPSKWFLLLLVVFCVNEERSLPFCDGHKGVDRGGIPIGRRASFGLPYFSGGSNAAQAIEEDERQAEQEPEPKTILERPSAPKSKSEPFRIVKRNGEGQLMDRNKVVTRLKSLCDGLDTRYMNIEGLTDSIIRGMYQNMTSFEIDTLAAETAASMSTQHHDYARLAARILITQSHRHTPATFSDAIEQLYGNGTGFINPNIARMVKRHERAINDHIAHERDWEFSYFGYKTLERAYLLKTDKGELLERPQYLLMRVALGIHCSNCDDDVTAEEELECLQRSFQTYDMMSQGYFTHASPTLFHSGTTHPQLSSCFLVQMSDDSIVGIYDTLKLCAVISKSAGGIGLSVHNIRARGTQIKGTRGTSNGLVPMLRVYDVTSRYVDQGGGKRPGAFAIYIEPWHADILDVLNLKKNHGKEEQRARDLFYGLWIPDLFMERVKNDDVWSLMCPHECKGLQNVYGEEFNQLYKQYEQEGKYTRQIRAREVWAAILESQIETGTPYMLYKDAANSKSNQQNLGTIQCSNLCTEIIQYTDKEEVAVCNLASLCLPKFVVSNRGRYGSINPKSTSHDNSETYFDHDALHKVTKIVTTNLNKIIDINSYPVQGSETSNKRHRPIGIGVSGLADTFIRLGLPFYSEEAKQLNQAIFETIYHAALEASNEIAKVDGSYETFQGSPASQGRLQFDLWGVTKKGENELSDDELPSHQYYAQNNVEQGQQESDANNDDNKQPNISVKQNYPDRFTNDQYCGYNWKELREDIKKNGLRNSLLVAPMPTASTSQILGVNECFEPYSSNLYIRRVKAGEFIMTNPHLQQDLVDRGLWTSSLRNQLMRDNGSVANIAEIPNRLKELYKTVWEMKMKDIIDMAADRGMFIDQSQSLNLFIAEPTVDKLTAMHFYAWKKGLKTGMYYLRTKPAVNAIQYTVDKSNYDDSGNGSFDEDDTVCLSCQA